jgi:hypothetical protein
VCTIGKNNLQIVNIFLLVSAVFGPCCGISFNIFPSTILSNRLFSFVYLSSLERKVRNRLDWQCHEVQKKKKKKEEKKLSRETLRTTVYETDHIIPSSINNCPALMQCVYTETTKERFRKHYHLRSL